MNEKMTYDYRLEDSFVKLAILPKAVQRFNTISIKIPAVIWQE